MKDEVTQLVHSILQHGIRLKSRLMRGEPLILENEQALLRKMLLSERDALRWPDYGGEPSAGSGKSDGRGGATAVDFLGIRYALVCWLDELFLVDSPWDARWNENKLELALYGTNDRAWQFWEQARLTESRPGTDSLSAFFLCVMLGFRGDLREHPDQLQGWVENCRRRLLRGEALWTPPPELTPATNVPPLRGREGLRRMVMSGGGLMLILIPVLAFVIVMLFMQPATVVSNEKKPPAAVTPEKGPEIPEEKP